MKKKVLLLLVVTVLSVSSLVGCGTDGEYTDTSLKEQTKRYYGNGSTFVIVDDGAGIYKIVYHEKNKVMYVVSDDIDGMGSFELLVNPDGTPMLYEGE